MDVSIREQLLNKSVTTLFFQLSIPAVVGMIVIGLYPPKHILLLFGVDYKIVIEAVRHFRIFYSLYFLYGIMVITITFFQSIRNGKKAGIIVLFRQLILFVPTMIILPKIIGIEGVWMSQPLVDFIMIVIGIIMLINEMKKLGKQTF